MLRAAFRTTIVAAMAAATIGLGLSAAPADAATPQCSALTNAGLGISIKACISKTGDGLVTTQGTVVDFHSNKLERGCTMILELNQLPNDVKFGKQTCLLQAEFHRTVSPDPYQRGCQGGQTYVAQIKVRFSAISGGLKLSNVVKSPPITC
jgi:hypothetical protein